MKIAVLGTGNVGQTLGTKLVAEGHEVMLGSRTADNSNAAEWAAANGDAASHGTFADAADFGEMAFLCTNGMGTVAAVKAAGAGNLDGKILIDLTNPLDFSGGMPPTLFAGNTDSLGEQVQAAVPGAKVVKSLNTISSPLMVNPGSLPGDHTIFVCGNDPEAKAQVSKWLGEWFGWEPGNILDLGDITTSRGTESYLALWIRMMLAIGGANFNIHVVRG